MRVRGLKLEHDTLKAENVKVAPHAGAWIEIANQRGYTYKWSKSHPMRVRGLKSNL